MSKEENNGKFLVDARNGKISGPYSDTDAEQLTTELNEFIGCKKGPFYAKSYNELRL